jgi:hypothetical protein
VTSKERVKSAIKHIQPDRVPLGELEIDAPIVEKVLGRPSYYGARLPLLKAYWEGRRDEAVDSMKRDYVEFIMKTGLDVAEIRLVPDAEARFLPFRQASESDFVDENDNVLKWSPETLEVMHVRKGRAPLVVAESPADGASSSARLPSPSELEFARYVVDKLGDTHFIVGPVGNSIGKPAVQCPWPQSMAAPYRDPAWLSDVLDRLIEEPERLRDDLVAEAEQIVPSVRYWMDFGCDTIWTAFDYGYNKATFMSPQAFEDFFYPALKVLSETVRRAGITHVFHSCGNNRALWEKFVQAGVNVYQSIQDEEPLQDLKKLHGRELTLWGGVSCRLLETGSPEQIAAQVRKSIDDAGCDGGFILGSTHSLGPGVRYDNFMTMLETWHSFR